LVGYSYRIYQEIGPLELDILQVLLSRAEDKNATFSGSSLPPKCFWFKNVQVVTARNNWLDDEACYVAIKGGNTTSNHGHADLGTFVFEKKGAA